MKVCVKLFAVARELSGREQLVVDLPPGATVADLREAIVTASPALAKIVPHALWAVDAEYARASTPLNEQSEVALIPPVSGG